MESYVGKLSEQWIRHDAHETVDNGTSREKRMRLEVTRRIRLVDITRVDSQVHKEEHDKNTAQR